MTETEACTSSVLIIRNKHLSDVKFNFQMMTKVEDAVSGIVFRYLDIFNWYSMEIKDRILYIKRMLRGKIAEIAKLLLPDF